MSTYRHINLVINFDNRKKLAHYHTHLITSIFSPFRIQKQQLAIARALVRNPAILILDEATSAVDNVTELAIQQSLAKISQDRTTILIAHRLSTVKHADQIFVLKHGEIVEQGTHQALLQEDQFYANLWKLQTGAQPLS